MLPVDVTIASGVNCFNKSPDALPSISGSFPGSPALVNVFHSACLPPSIELFSYS